MSSIKKWAGLFFILSLLLLSACKGQDAAEPTVDPDMIYTAAAMTVEAQLTQAAAQNPTATNTQAPPTQAIPPTLTVQSQGNEAGTTPGAPLFTSTPLVLATFTSSPRPPSAAAKYELVDQDPDDGSVLAPDLKFDMVWVIKNTGTDTWNELYTVEFFLGDRVGGGHYTTNRYYFREPVAPGESTSIIVDMKTSGTNGEYYSWWKIKDDQGNNFGDLDVTIVVSNVTP